MQTSPHCCWRWMVRWKTMMWSWDVNKAIRPSTRPPTAWIRPKRSRLRRQRLWDGCDSGGAEGVERSVAVDPSRWHRRDRGRRVQDLLGGGGGCRKIDATKTSAVVHPVGSCTPMATSIRLRSLKPSLRQQRQEELGSGTVGGKGSWGEGLTGGGRGSVGETVGTVDIRWGVVGISGSVLSDLCQRGVQPLPLRPLRRCGQGLRRQRQDRSAPDQPIRAAAISAVGMGIKATAPRPAGPGGPQQGPVVGPCDTAASELAGLVGCACRRPPPPGLWRRWRDHAEAGDGPGGRGSGGTSPLGTRSRGAAFDHPSRSRSAGHRG
jgi:hypothetical protein